jgi:hypothetical protein
MPFLIGTLKMAGRLNICKVAESSLGHAFLPAPSNNDSVVFAAEYVRLPVEIRSV